MVTDGRPLTVGGVRGRSTSALKVMTIVGTRPEIIKLSRVIAALDRATAHVLVHTGQNYDYELSGLFFEKLGLRAPDHSLDAAGGSAARTIGQAIIAIDDVLAAVRPEAVLVLGDTNSALSVIAAKRRHIPIFHMEAGNRCFDQRVPEETNRRIVDHVADINMPYSAIARDYLLAEGIPADRIVKTGSPMFEVLTHYRANIEASDVTRRLDLTPHGYFVVSCHREEIVDSDKSLADLARMLEAIAASYRKPIIFSTHPRTRKRIETLGLTFDPLVQLLKPFDFFDYNALQVHAHAVLSDSGTISEESSILNFPALNLRETHERPEAMEEAAVMMTGMRSVRVLQGLSILEDQGRGAIRTLRLPADYAIPNVSDKVVRTLLSYTDYVRRSVWKEY